MTKLDNSTPLVVYLFKNSLEMSKNRVAYMESMGPEEVKEVLMKAGKAVEGLPEHLQPTAFELAVSMLSGVGQAASSQPRSGAPAAYAASRHAPLGGEADAPEIADLLRVCKRNPDRYVAFMADLERKSEVATTASLVECFRIYRQDLPKLPARDLGDLVAKGWIELVGKGRDASFVLKRKGRERLKELAALIGD